MRVAERLQDKIDYYEELLLTYTNTHKYETIRAQYQVAKLLDVLYRIKNDS